MPVSGRKEEMIRLWRKFFHHEAFSASDVDRACEFQTSDDAFEQFVGNLVLAAAKGLSESTMAPVLLRECAAGFERSRSYAENVLYVLNGAPAEFLVNQTEIRTYIFDAVRSDKTAARLNAILPLTKMAPSDPEALELIRNALGDMDENVRRNAVAHLAKLSQ